MSYKIIWEPNSEISFYEEIDYIFLKWNFKEVQKFQDLVKNNLERLSINPEIGVYQKSRNAYSIVLSKQTTLYYVIDFNNRIVYLVTFWNNLRNPDDLAKLL